MKTFQVLTLCFTAVFAAPTPQKLSMGPYSTQWNWQASVLEDFEANLRRMQEKFDQLEKSFESGFRFPNIEETDGVQILENGTNIFDLDPSKVKNESFSDTKIVDGKVVRTEEKVIAHGNSVVHFKKVEITPKDAPALPSDGRPKILSKTPVSPVPELTTSKNEIDSEHVDQDADEKSNSPRDVEEIDSVSPSGASVHSIFQSRQPQKQIYLI